MEQKIKFKCKKCRKALFQEEYVIVRDAHGNPVSSNILISQSALCSSVLERQFLYLGEEDPPLLVQAAVDESGCVARDLYYMTINIWKL